MNALMRRFRPEQIRELVLVVLIFLVVIFFLGTTGIIYISTRLRKVAIDEKENQKQEKRKIQAKGTYDIKESFTS